MRTSNADWYSASRFNRPYPASALSTNAVSDAKSTSTMPKLSLEKKKITRIPSLGAKDEDSCSAACTPPRGLSRDVSPASSSKSLEDVPSNKDLTASSEEDMTLRWSVNDEVFRIARPVQADPRSQVAVLEGRLYFSVVSAKPDSQPGVHYFCTDEVLRYTPFCADFGPLNLGMTDQFCALLQGLLTDRRLSNTKLVYCAGVSTDQSLATNAIYLLGAFLVLRLGAKPEAAWAPFSRLSPSPCRPYRDCTWVPSPYDLPVRECWEGLAHAVKVGLHDPATFSREEYFYYDSPQNGDLHEVVKGKFFAFKGPSGRRRPLGLGRGTLTPPDYFDVFRAKNIRAVIRLNRPEYDASTVVQGGFAHHDLFFVDCSTPPDAVADKFLRLAEAAPAGGGAFAVHCLAGLGRTGTLIALYLMKHYQFTADAAMGWLRVCRPGSVIGPQQKYLKDSEQRMWRLGAAGASGLGGPADGGPGPAKPAGGFPAAAAGGDGGAESELAEMVAKGMLKRDLTRAEPPSVAGLGIGGVGVNGRAGGGGGGGGGGMLLGRGLEGVGMGCSPLLSRTPRRRSAGTAPSSPAGAAAELMPASDGTRDGGLSLSGGGVPGSAGAALGGGGLLGEVLDPAAGGGAGQPARLPVRPARGLALAGRAVAARRLRAAAAAAASV